MRKRKSLLLGIMVMFFFSACEEKEIREADCVGSFVLNHDYSLEIVANRDQIDNRVSFAWELYEMCVTNAFHSTMFSYDLNGYPETITMDIYLWEEQIGEADPVMQVEFRPEDEEEEYDIKNDKDKYMLYIDGKCEN